MTAHMSRRRFIAIAAAAGAQGLLPRHVFGRGLETAAWRGVALGAEASLTLQHSDRAAAQAAIEAALAEVARLEGIFSLFRPDSALSRLNAAGRLDDAPADFRMLLNEALHLAARSGGAFDPTVQPLWALYARHFGRAGPTAEDIEAALARTGWRHVAVDGARILLLKPGMALTLNGIAQGYITDKVGDLLRARGFTHVLVNMGEQLALGPREDASPWAVGIADPAAPGRTVARLPLTDGAVATSGSYGTRLDPEGRIGHILDPRTGRPAARWASVTVVAPRAVLADGLSTALSVAPDAAGLLGGSVRAFVVPRGASAGHWL